MSRRTWKKNNLYISFSEPRITPFDEDQVKDMEDVMYLYYSVLVMNRKNELLKMDAYDFPKVQDLPAYIDYIMNFDMSKAYITDDIKEGGFERKITYLQVLLEDTFNVEYFYKIERFDYEVKQADEVERTKWTEYILTIGDNDKDRTFSNSIIIRHITPEELMNLKKIAEDFCKEAIRLYHKDND